MEMRGADVRFEDTYRVTLLLKQLHIHGFKSFATPTTFAFDRGMTAVIGPNGSGKSNVAEALRWVLGEQAGSNLRSRKTEDVIFAGSDKRSQLAMAEVILTLDNHDGDLPLPFAEITVARRAFRTGENQYLINGARVRLKDVHQLVAPLGQSYTIIGQGLVDAALSQRPEERRGLFEHAAGISGLRMRANEAERSLTEASGNAQRLRDILGELEPRVRSLDRQARLAREYGTVRTQLSAMHHRYYSALWSGLSERLNDAFRVQSAAEEQHALQEREYGETSHRLAILRGNERRLVDESQQRREALTARERELADARHRCELLAQRTKTVDERAIELRNLIAELASEQTSLSDGIERTQTHHAAVSERIAAMENELREHDSRLSEARERRAHAQQAIAEIERQQRDIVQELARVEGTLHSFAERRAAIDRERQETCTTQHSTATRTGELDNERAELRERATAQRREVDALEAQRLAVDAVIALARNDLTSLQPRIEQAERDVTRTQARLEVLERAHASGEGLYSGVRAVVRAVRKNELAMPGLLGTVAETVVVPSNLESAIEVALGGHLQDIIVAQWSDAQAAIDFLMRSNAGRATFQPLETVRPSLRPTIDIRDTAILGVAADLVEFPESVRSVIEQILGRTLVVSDLEAVQRIVRQVNAWTLVTLNGEITRPSGAVTGGSRVQEAGMLARERERRTLPRTVAEQRATLETLHHDRDVITDTVRQQSQILARLHDDDERLTREHRVVEHELERANRERDALSKQAAVIVQRLDDIDERASQLATTEQAMRQRQSERQRSLDTLAATLSQLIDEHAAALDEPDDRMGALRVELATGRERLRADTLEIERLRDRMTVVSQLVIARQNDVTQLLDESRSSLERKTLLDDETSRLAGEINLERGRLTPLESERRSTEASLASAEIDLNLASEKLREAERERDRATLGLARVQDEQVFLSERIRNDLDVTEPHLLDTEDGDEPAPTDADIARLRERLRRMSVVSEDVLEQFETESTRLEYLSAQLADVDNAANGLRKVLAELNASMSARFADTFRDVALMFEQTFTRLFGGGSARLVLGSSDDMSAGIDIVAQPPGKRLQNLNALSGGERTLTAVALLIAIQRVNPSPFCMLDEVDAALDESNVVRFRNELRELTSTTQFVVITHNRGTIEGADTLYGVTMGDDGVSRVLSLRLEEAIRTVDNFALTRSTEA